MTGLPFVDGGAGNDTITGSKFADRLLGGDGNDTMSAGAGTTSSKAASARHDGRGLGGDRFDFDAVAEIGKKKGLLDLITDWGDGDKIDLSSIDANGAKKGDKAFKFLKKEGADFTDKAGQLGFDQKKGNDLRPGRHQRRRQGRLQASGRRQDRLREGRLRALRAGGRAQVESRGLSAPAFIGARMWERPRTDAQGLDAAAAMRSGDSPRDAG